ncbi:MAG: minichromosome maintenance protein MCM [Candidatus Micrarchaeia archaeon]
MLQEKFDEFFSTYYKEEISNLFLAFPKKRSLEVEIGKLAEFDLECYDSLINKPDETISAALESLKSFNKNPNIVFQNNLHIRFTGLDPSKAPLIQDVGANEIGKLIVVDGLVTKRAEVKPKVSIAALRCVYCGAYYKTEVTNEPLPQLCPECHRKGLKQVDEESKFINLQKAEIQDPLERLRGGSPASHLEIWMEDDLVNTIVPGDRVLVHGILRIKPQKVQSKVYSTFLDVVSIKKLQKEFEEIELTPEEERRIIELSKDPNIFEKIAASIAPSIYGYNEIKRAIALQLFGGTPDKVLADGGKVRADIHILLIGDPGSAKTRLLQYTSSIVPKGIYVSGKSVSSAGLTATAERDELADGGWTLKAGVLVLASGGLAAIDEFDKISDEDKAALHEAMESQSISVAKAGIVARLNTRTSVLAAANPKFGRFDLSQYPAEQFDIPPTLLSRFDLIFPMIDIMDEERDKKIAEHILKQHSQEVQESERRSFSPIDAETLRKYIAYARKNIKPKLTKEAAKTIEKFYISLRKLGKEKGAVPITPRQIEALVRLAEASAKARLSEKVEARDAENAISLINYMLQTLALDKSTNRVDIDSLTIGLPKSKVEKMNVILQIVKDLQEKSKEKEVKIDDVVEEAKNKGIDEFLSKKLINDLIEHGDLYRPKFGFVKVVSEEE